MVTVHSDRHRPSRVRENGARYGLGSGPATPVVDLCQAWSSRHRRRAGFSLGDEDHYRHQYEAAYGERSGHPGGQP